jgi:DNA-binding transcriptional MerR regulator
MTDSPTYFPIRELVRRTGVHASTLRAWENRHGLLTPLRTPSGHRLYNQEDVQRVRRLQELLVQGLSLSQIGDLLDTSVPDSPPPSAALPAGEPWANRPTSVWQAYLLDTLRAVEDFSTERLDALYNEACAIYPIDVLTLNLLVPVLEHLGERWRVRPSGVAEEHFFTAWLRNKLGARLHHGVGQARGKALLMACLAHENHEIGLLLFALGAMQRGYRAIYLGANLPIRELAHVVPKAHPSAIVLAGRDGGDNVAALADIAWLTTALDIPVFVGSHFSVRERDALIGMAAIPLGSHIANGLDRLETRLARPSGRAAAPRRRYP